MIKLGETNEKLLKENRDLRIQMANSNLLYPHHGIIDQVYDYFEARAINYTYRRPVNYLTLDKGKKDQIEPGMSVINRQGVIGQVKAVSRNFATVTSLLHRDLLLSCLIQSTKTLCTVQWEGHDPKHASLKYVPRHIQIQAGDTVFTSGFNAAYPKGIVVGVVNKADLEDNNVFYDAEISLSVDFSGIDYVYVIKNTRKAEQDSLENITTTNKR